MLKLARLLLIISILTVFTACGKNNPGTTADKPATSQPVQESGKVEESQKPNEGPLDSNPIEDSKKLREMMPKLQKDIKKVLIDDARKLWPSFNTADKQILLLNPSNKMGYLINNQKSDIGSKDEVIEYNTDSIKDVQLLVTPFQLTTFNDHPTYVFNVDAASYFGIMSGDQAYEKLLKFIVHEGVHLLLQKGGETAEGMGSRAETYPESVDSRYYRNEMYHYLKEAALSANKEDKIDRIQKAVYFYDLYLKEDQTNKSQDPYDNIEGMATYLEEKAFQMLTHPNASAAELNTLIAQGIINNAPMTDDNMLLPKPMEFYNIGGLGIACAVELGLDPNAIFTTSPLSLLKSKFGSKNAEGHADVKQQNNIFYTNYNQELKSYVDDITSKMNDDQYAAVKVPITAKNSGGQFTKFIQYEYKGKPAEIQGVSREVVIGDLRIKFTNLKTIFVMNPVPAPSKNGPMDLDEVMGYSIAYVPKKDIQISKDNLLTIQRDDLMIFDAKYELKDGEYQILAN